MPSAASCPNDPVRRDLGRLATGVALAVPRLRRSIPWETALLIAVLAVTATRTTPVGPPAG